jgi:hypothetical protein
MKVRRQVVEERHKELIESLYAEEESGPDSEVKAG